MTTQMADGIAAAPLVYAEEAVTDALWNEISPLLVQHWRELSAHLDIPLSVNRGFYEQADREGALCLVTARREGALVGYAAFLIRQNPHYQTSRQAVQDVLYVHPSVRGGRIGLCLIRAADARLRARGCQVVYHHVKRAHPILGRLLERAGYTPVETIYSHRLDREDM